MKTPLSDGPCDSADDGLILVSAVALVNKQRQVLMQRRQPHGEHGGLWEFPGGKLEPNESPEASAVREIEEELGLTIMAQDLVPVSFACGTSQRSGRVRPLTIMLFVCKRFQGTPAPHAATQLEWVDLADLEQLAMPPLDYPLAARLIESLGCPPN